MRKEQKVSRSKLGNFRYENKKMVCKAVRETKGERREAMKGGEEMKTMHSNIDEIIAKKLRLED